LSDLFSRHENKPKNEDAAMRIIDAEPQIIADLKDEGELITSKRTPTFEVTAVRHPTLGKLVIVARQDGSGGVVVETEE
jgi:hypothetical protein